MQEIEGRKEAEEKGEDYDRNKYLNIQSDVAEKIRMAKKRKSRPDPGFVSKSLTSQSQIKCIGSIELINDFIV